jgi:predicted nuclease with TOPRIM domain
MSDEQTTFFSVVWAGVATVIAALSSALTYLFRLRENENSRNIAEIKEQNKKLEVQVEAIREKADQCEDDRSTLFSECSVLKFEVVSLKTKLASLGGDMKTMEDDMKRMDMDGTDYSQKHFPKDHK